MIKCVVVVSNFVTRDRDSGYNKIVLPKRLPRNMFYFMWREHGTYVTACNDIVIISNERVINFNLNEFTENLIRTAPALKSGTGWTTIIDELLKKWNTTTERPHSIFAWYRVRTRFFFFFFTSEHCFLMLLFGDEEKLKRNRVENFNDWPTKRFGRTRIGVLKVFSRGLSHQNPSSRGTSEFHWPVNIGYIFLIPKYIILYRTFEQKGWKTLHGKFSFTKTYINISIFINFVMKIIHEAEYSWNIKGKTQVNLRMGLIGFVDIYKYFCDEN